MLTDPNGRSGIDQLSGLASGHRKDLAQEERLAAMNELVAPLQADLEAGHDRPQHAPVFVLGPPRGGTTVTSQLIASSGLFGITTNFMARFWRAPALGLTIQNALGFGDDPQVSSYESRRGVTLGWREPSEFGYFWSGFFDLGQNTHVLGPGERARLDAVGMARAVASMEHVAGRPMAFKNNTWFTLNADALAQVFPGCVLVVCDRDPFFIAQSIWLNRLDHYGDPNCWWSVRPSDYEHIVTLDPLEQVAAQAVSIKAEMAAKLATAKSAKIVFAGYDRLTSDPRSLISEIAMLVGYSNEETISARERLPLQLPSTNSVRLDAKTASALRAYVDRHMERRGLSK